MSKGFGIGAGLCLMAALFGLWQHNVGAVTGWFIAAVACLRIWASERNGQEK